jgi:hypothetical protein
MNTLFFQEWRYWELNQKVTFDGANKLIIIVDGIESIDVKQDFYSDWKEWVLLDDNSKYLPAISCIGGEPTTNGQSIAPTFFLINGWKIRTWEGPHVLEVNGNLFSDDGSNPFVRTLTPQNISISLKTSSIVTQVEKPVAALSSIESAQLMSLQNVDLVALVDSIWDKEIKPGVTAAEYIVNKLLTTNKFIGLK